MTLFSNLKMPTLKVIEIVQGTSEKLCHKSIQQGSQSYRSSTQSKEPCPEIFKKKTLVTCNNGKKGIFIYNESLDTVGDISIRRVLKLRLVEFIRML